MTVTVWSLQLFYRLVEFRMMALSVQPKMVENGIKSQANSIPVHSRAILQNGESFM